MFPTQSWTVNLVRCSGRGLTAVPRQIPVDATAVHLDTNSLGLLGPECFLGRSKLTRLFLNSSKITGGL